MDITAPEKKLQYIEKKNGNKRSSINRGFVGKKFEPPVVRYSCCKVLVEPKKIIPWSKIKENANKTKDEIDDKYLVKDRLRIVAFF